MNNGTKLTLAFLGGAVAGAAALALLNRGKLNFDYLKPLATELMSKGMDWKDVILAKFDAMKENMEDLAAEARDQADARKTTAKPEDDNQHA